MPTPINHLIIAKRLFEKDRLKASVHGMLERERGPFLLGHTAPDVQTVSQQPRHETHFYTLPPSDETPAHQALLSAYPELATPEEMEPARAAFIAGYLAHLLVDEAWWREIFYPFFGTDETWASWEERIFFHNVLRTYLDRQDQTRLNGSIGRDLARAEPDHWLPFASDETLCAWRDLLARQLQPGERIRTAEVFAARMRLPAGRIEAALRSGRQMGQLFHHVPQDVLDRYRSDVLRRSGNLINSYLGGCL